VRLWPFGAAAEQRSANPLENPTMSMSASADDLLSFFGVAGGSKELPLVTIDTALEVPAVIDVVGFLSRTMAALPRHSFRKKNGEAERADGTLQMLVNEAPNAEWGSFAFWQYFWQQVFTGGRGCAWIERVGTRIIGLWPMDPDQMTVRRQGGRKIYRFGDKDYPASEVIDVVWMLKRNQIDAYSPILKHRRTIGLAMAMENFAAGFFGGDGIPPLALEGPLPQGVEGFKRATNDIQRAIKLAKEAGRKFFGMPPGHILRPIGIDPDKGQMTEARLFQIQEIARIYGLPPVFVQDLSKGTFSNTEQQDLQLVKHLIVHWAKALEDELNLKLFGQRRRSQYVEHNLDALQRGDFKSRIEALARGVNSALITPDEARGLENRPPKPGGDKLYIQGATVPIEMAGKVTVKAPPEPPANGDPSNDDAGTEEDA
jgi:HK97 family phage portal protein